MTTQNDARPRRGQVLLVAGLVALALAGGGAARTLGWMGRPGGPGAPGGPPPPVTAGAGPVSFSGQLDRSAVLVGGDPQLRLELVMRGGEGDLERAPLRVPTDLVVVLDRSGSMEGEPLRLAKAAIHELLARLGPEDRFALVSYASGSWLEIPLAAATPEALGSWRGAVERITAGGGTNLSSGIDQAHALLAATRQARRAARVVLLSDGHANEGDPSLEGLRTRAGRAVPGEYVLSAVGIGAGFDETLMSALADAGTGNFYYVAQGSALAGVFEREFASARATLARALVVTLEPAAGLEVLDVAGYPLERAGREVRFRPGDLFAGQERRVWVTWRMDAREPGERALGRVALAWADPHGANHELVLEGLPKLAAVLGEGDYYARFDRDAYQRAARVDGLNLLRQQVATSLQAGERKQALDAIRSYRAASEAEQQQVLGEKDEALGAALGALESRVEAPEAASPERQNTLAKEMWQEARDGRRAGSKR